MVCLGDDRILTFVQGGLDAKDGERVEQHLATCSRCHAVVAEAAKALYEDPAAGDAVPVTAAGADSDRRPRPTLSPGAKVLRYEIIAPIGSGATGIVYRAHDPQLRRSVALKVLDPPGQSFLREAQAMAQLTHPNVVRVYDVGTFGSSVVIVMELVEGPTVAVWLRSGDRSWREIVDKFMDAGRGLAAAHQVKLVHRDFKPENLLIGPDDTARVTDFGLARAEQSAPAAPGMPPVPAVGAGSASVTGTGAGTFAGTPAFMAPEQFLGRPADARTDQFSFCVALYVALYGRHPFDDRALGEHTIFSLATSVVNGEIKVHRAPREVPTWLHATLLRGLRTNADQRYASMDDLLAALERGCSRRIRARRVLLAAGIAAAACAAIAAVTLGTPPQATPGAALPIPIPSSAPASPAPPPEVRPPPSAPAIVKTVRRIKAPPARPAALPKPYGDTLKNPF